MARGPVVTDPVRGIVRHYHIRRRDFFVVDYVIVLTAIQHGWGEWHPEIARLDRVVDHFNHIRPRRVSQYRTVAQSARSKLFTPLEPRDNLPFRQQPGHSPFDPVNALDR